MEVPGTSVSFAEIMETQFDYDPQEQYDVPRLSKYLDLRVDWAFKYVLSKKEILLKLLENSKSSFYFLELSRMKEREWEKLQKNPERWCYLFKNMSKFATERAEPKELHGFEDVLDAARVDCLSPEEMDNYQDMLDAVRYENRMADLYEKQQAEARGEAKEKVKMAKALKSLDVPVDTISQASGLSIEVIKAL